jgi:hypothetical protein
MTWPIHDSSAQRERAKTLRLRRTGLARQPIFSGAQNGLNFGLHSDFAGICARILSMYFRSAASSCSRARPPQSVEFDGYFSSRSTPPLAFQQEAQPQFEILLISAMSASAGLRAPLGCLRNR